MKTESLIFRFDEILEASYLDAARPEGIHFVGCADFYVYLDFRVSTGGIFYVGKGNSARVKQKSRRGDHHARIVGKHRLCRVAFPILSELEALDIEKRLVEVIGRLDLGTGPLVNTCDGGGAPANFGPEVIARIRENNGMHRPEVKARHAANTEAARADPDVKARYAAAMADPEVKAKFTGENNGMFGRGDLIAGERNPMHGKTHSPEAKAKQKAAAEERKRIADELGIGYRSVTKAVIAQYKAGNLK
jgi:hypothetical protein